MRNHEHRAFAPQTFDRFLHDALGLGVERAGRLVEHQDRRILHQRARDGDALTLAA